MQTAAWISMDDTGAGKNGFCSKTCKKPCVSFRDYPGARLGVPEAPSRLTRPAARGFAPITAISD
jgi:hypothetical protein